MNIYNTESCQEFARFVAEGYEGNKEGLYMHIATKACVWTGDLPTINTQECENNNLEIGKGKYLAGTIVNMKNDITLCLTTWGMSDYAPRLVDSFAEYLEKEKNIPIERDENDVLAKGKKVLSWARITNIKGWTQSFIHFQ